MDDHDHDHDAAVGANEAIETVKTLIKKEHYKDASEYIKMAMQVYPLEGLVEQNGFGILIIAETLYYGDISLSNCNGFDGYSVLQIPPSSTQVEVETRFDELSKEVTNLIEIDFPGAKLCDFYLQFDRPRKDCVFLDWPIRPSNKKITTASSSASFRESYLDWKPPIYRVNATENVQLWKKLKLYHLSPCLHQEDEQEEPPHHQEEEEEEKEKEEDLCLSPELETLKRKVFDEMPQNPNYTPLEKYTRKIREGMILGLELAFTKLCEEIRNLVDVQSFWYELDGFNEQLSQLKEMGYNVEKVCERIDTLKEIAEWERASRATVEKFEDEVMNEEVKVINLEAAIKKSKDIIANRKSKIENLKKDSSEAVAEFAATAKAKWV